MNIACPQAAKLKNRQSYFGSPLIVAIDDPHSIPFVHSTMSKTAHDHGNATQAHLLMMNLNFKNLLDFLTFPRLSRCRGGILQACADDYGAFARVKLALDAVQA